MRPKTSYVPASLLILQKPPRLWGELGQPLLLDLAVFKGHVIGGGGDDVTSGGGGVFCGGGGGGDEVTSGGGGGGDGVTRGDSSAPGGFFIEAGGVDFEHGKPSLIS